ncbi:MAG: Ig-like domain-containing protein [Smithella sp.]
MKLNKLLFFILISLLVISYSGCSGGGGGGGSTSTSAVTLASIAVTPANPGILLSGTVTTEQFTATGTYSDSTTKNLTTSVTWSSSNTDVATISNTSGSNGLATLLAAGQTTITASSGSITGSTLLTLQADNNDNRLTVSVNGSLCTNSYPNKPCVSVTICTSPDLVDTPKSFNYKKNKEVCNGKGRRASVF